MLAILLVAATCVALLFPNLVSWYSKKYKKIEKYNIGILQNTTRKSEKYKNLTGVDVQAGHEADSENCVQRQPGRDVCHLCYFWPPSLSSL